MVTILDFAKHLNATGQPCGLDKDIVHREIEKRASAARLPNQTAQQAYVAVLETPEGQELYRAYKRAPAAPVQAAQDFADEPRSRGPAADEMDRVVDEFMRNYNRANSKKLTREQSYDRVFNSEANRELRDRVRAEERAATRDVAQQREPIFTAARQFSR
jgi:hypothetical protein